MIYIVMGMHRSGTSAIAGLLHNNGIDMGGGFFSPEPSQENPKGFCEDHRFREINDAVLKCHGYFVDQWKVPTGTYVKATPAIFQRAINLVNKARSKAEDWGWKDPRTCLTYPFWFEVLDCAGLLSEARIIGTSREGAHSARSMIKRGNRCDGIAPGYLEHHFMQVAAKYEQCMRLARPDTIIKFTDSPKVVHERLVVARLISAGGFALKTDFLDDSLRNRTT